MNEEEKEAVETFKHWIEYEKNNKEKINKADELISMQECILGIIDKQQKQIEEVKKEKGILIEKYTDVVYECVKRNEKIEFLKKRLYRKGVFSKEKFIRFYPKQYQNKVVKIWVNECDGLTPREMEELGYDVLEECLI